LAAGELEWEFLGSGRGQADFVEETRDLLASFGAVSEAMNQKGFFENVADRVARVERFGRILKDHLQVAPVGFETAGRDPGDVGVFEFDAAGGGFEETDHGFADGGFAAARFPDETQRLAWLDGQRHPVHGAAPGGGAGKDSTADGEVDLQVSRGKQGHC
jgi:hypothetical protein